MKGKDLMDKLVELQSRQWTDVRLGADSATLDGDYKVEDLELIIQIMQHKGTK